MPQETISAFERHNHRRCSDRILKQADALTVHAGIRLTPVRRRVLEILLEEHQALGAYQVLERLAAEGFGKQPPVAYRALEFLVEHGLAHRVRRLNAFTACMHPETPHSPVFFICSGCDAVAEIIDQTISKALKNAAARIGFTVERGNIESIGICPKCRKESRA